MRCLSQIVLKSGLSVPCGKCPACKANERQEWVFRLQREFEVSSFGLFVTLTYDDEHLPSSGVSKRDVQLFLKRLRKHFNSNELRYYIVSEYGDNTHRPHYHGLFFHKTQQNDLRTIYDIYEGSWKNGFCYFGKVELASIVYCTKYCLKKKHVPAHMNSNFRLVSKMNGGLGVNYLNSMYNFHVENYNYKFVSYNGKRTRMPRYYKNVILQSLPEDVANSVKLQNIQNYRDSIEQLYVDNEKKFAEWLKIHKGLSFEQAYEGFAKHQETLVDRRNYLIEKHTKKQKM